MKKIVFGMLSLLPFLTLAQDPVLFDETWYLKNIRVDNSSLAPLVNASTLTIEQNPNGFLLTTTGINNELTGTISFDDLNEQFEFQTIAVTNLGCDTYGCDFEEDYFYAILSTDDLVLKTLNYTILEFGNGIRRLTISDENAYSAVYLNTPAENIDENLFQTWYLFRTQGDLDPPIPVTSPTPPQVTISQNLAFQGTNGCVTFEGVFAYSDYFNLNFNNYLQIKYLTIDDLNCENGEQASTGIPDFITEFPLNVYNLTDNRFEIESFPGFISSFRNILLNTTQTNLNGLKIFPSPVAETLSILNPENSTITSVEILDAQGKQVLVFDSFIQNMNVGALPSGIYFVKIKSNSFLTIEKIIKR